MQIQLSQRILFKDMEPKKKRRIGEILIEHGVLTAENLEEALNYQKGHGGLIGQILITLGYVSEEDVVAALTAQLDVPYLPLTNYSVNFDTARMIDEEFCRRNVLVLFDHDEEKVFVALADPLNDTILNDVTEKMNLRPQVFISTATEIVNMLDLTFNQSSSGSN